jgi:hypothetical protein
MFAGVAKDLDDIVLYPVVDPDDMLTIVPHLVDIIRDMASARAGVGVTTQELPDEMIGRSGLS